ncbi:MAG: shikimate dehydrogenase [Lentisphaeria bacterium]|nr:shikimate dehydrogenase [Lentisphaeria bacterium]
MERYGLIGHPVGHSKSPAMQEAGFQTLGIQACYELIDVEPQNLVDIFQSMRKTHRGWNVTIPHKEAVVPLVDELDDEARQLGSVNTVVNVGGRLKGYSTDGYGLETALKEAFGFDFSGRSICFLGTGGAARATAVIAALHGAKRLLLVNRTVERAERLAESVRKVGGTADVLPLDATAAIADALTGMDVLVQCTSLGLKADDPLPFSVELLPQGLPVMDMVYGRSRFRRLAGEAGHPNADGRGMLLHQGCRSFELWTGREAPVEEMRAALAHSIGQG